MTRALHITFVCTGNTCRSPIAEAIARRAIAEREIAGVTVGSAGVAALEGAPASGGARRVAAEEGLNLDDHRSAPLTVDIVAASHVILCMDRFHLLRARELGGGCRCRLLAETGGEVGDPFGGSDETYRATFREIHRLVAAALNGVEAGTMGIEAGWGRRAP